MILKTLVNFTIFEIQIKRKSDFRIKTIKKNRGGFTEKFFEDQRTTLMEFKSFFS